MKHPLAAVRSMRRRWVHHRLRPQPSISGCDGESQLDLHQLDRDLFCAKKRSLWVPPGGRGVFGGQVIGQALHAASLSVDADRACHSLHGLFILPGDPKHDIIYRVGRSSDRRSFASRSVQAVQHGQVIFQAEMSFTTSSADQPALSHQREMPDVPPPESLPSHVELLDRLLPSLPSSLHAAVEKMRSMPVEMRMVDPPDLLELRPPSKPARQYIWMRISQPLGASPGVHRACAAYFSDHALLTTALRPHGINFPSPRLGAVASLDHSMWFHTASFRADEWMLYEMDSPWAGHGRGLSFGYLYDARGVLQVTCAQEGVLRMARPSAKSWLAQAVLGAMSASRDIKSWLGWAAPAASSVAASQEPQQAQAPPRDQVAPSAGDERVPAEK